MLLAVLMLACSMPAPARAQSWDAYMGFWELQSIAILGMTMEAEQLSYHFTCYFHEDDMVTWVLDDEYMIAPVTWESGACVIRSTTGPIAVTMDGQGCLCMTLESGRMTMDMRLRRGTPPVPAAEAAPMVGTWAITSAEYRGVLLAGDTLEGSALTVYPDQYGVMTLMGDQRSIRLDVRGGELMLIDDPLSHPVVMESSERAVIRLQESQNDEETITLTLARTGGAEAAAASKVTHACDGHWKAVKTRAMGMEFALSELGVSRIEVTIDGDKGYLVWDDGEFPCMVIPTADGVQLIEESVTVPCVLDGQGYLVMTLASGDMSTEVFMVLAEEETPAAPREELSAHSEFLGRWKAISVARSDEGVKLAAEGDITLEMNADTAVYSLSGTAHSIPVGFVDGVCVMPFDGEEYVCTIDAAGQLLMRTESVTTVFWRVGETPAMNSACNGCWKTVSTIARGQEYTPEETKADRISLIMTGSTALLTLDDETFGCQVFYGDYGVEIFTGSTTYPAGLNEQGQLMLTMETVSATYQLVMERGEQAPPAADFDGTWKTVAIDFGNRVVSAEEVGAELDLIVLGGMATCSYDSTTYSAAIALEGNTLTLAPGDGELVFVLNEKGQLCYVMPTDASVTWLLERQVN